MTTSTDVGYDDPINRERPLKIDDKKKYLRICLGIAFYNALPNKRLTAYKDAAVKAFNAIKNRDDATLNAIRHKLDEADEHLMGFLLYQEPLPK